MIRIVRNKLLKEFRNKIYNIGLKVYNLFTKEQIFNDEYERLIDILEENGESIKDLEQTEIIERILEMYGE